MSPVPLIPDTAPFSPEQRAWLNGFLAGVFSRAPSPSSLLPSPASAALAPLTILFGSQTGTAETLAKQAAKEAGKRGFAPTIVDMAQTDLARLAQEKNLLVITSTYGDGEPPDSAKALHAALKSASLENAGGVPSPRFAALRFSVCALGDTNYTLFCQCGKDFDAFLEKLSATRAAPRADCDLDYEEKFRAWLNTALAALAGGSAPVSSTPAEAAPAATAETGYSRKNPFSARVLAVRNLSAAGSAKEVNHVEFCLAGSGLAYAAGDALGVVPQNCPTLVADILAALGCDGEEAVPAPDRSTTSLRRALTEFYDLGKPSAELLALAALNGGAAPLHVVDALLAAKARPSPSAFVGALKRLQPRLYSISSSPKAHESQVHLTVGAVRFEAGGRRRKGVCSTFLAERALSVGTAGVFVHSNSAFRPPADGATPMIMVGPGTGIAPFRAFLE
jgi:sulfite reductase (NADPH) flavoprotein alpha-component